MSATKFDVISSNDGVLWGSGPLASHGDTWSSIILSVVTPLFSQENFYQNWETDPSPLLSSISLDCDRVSPATGEGFSYLVPVIYLARGLTVV